MKAILTDTTKCVGCFECQSACKRENRLPRDANFRWVGQDGLSATAFTTVLRHPTGELVRKQCRHCREPACASACPVGALHQTPLGAVVYDAHKCLGCRYCMMACPFGIPRYQWESAVPYVRKCTLCYPRLRKGQQPACTEACPTKATIFGERDALLAEARRRLAEEPERYHPTIFGEKDVGGTNVLYLSRVDLGFLHLGRHPGQRPLPDRTRFAMNAVPFAFVGMGALAGAVYWVSSRRTRLAEEAAARSAAENPEAAAAPAAEDETPEDRR